MMQDDERQRMERKHIFIVNGDPSFLELLRELFQDERYNVTTTNFVPGTINQIVALNPALIIIDAMVGERAGWDLLEELEEEAVTRDIPVLVTSTIPEYLERAKEQEARYGANRYMVKPMDLVVLLQHVHELVGEA
jgi:DNA-binding response OmpR family regulator